jgi:hypothetical protein
MASDVKLRLACVSHCGAASSSLAWRGACAAAAPRPRRHRRESATAASASRASRFNNESPRRAMDSRVGLAASDLSSVPPTIAGRLAAYCVCVWALKEQ